MMKNILKKETSNKKAHGPSWKGEFALVGADPYVDWSIIVVIFCLLSAMFVYLGVVTYTGFDITISANNPSSQSSAHKVADFDGLKEVIKKFERVEMEIGELSGIYETTSDPSL